MSAPTPDQVRVATEKLHHEADVWTAQSESLNTLLGQANQLTMTRLEAGPFQLVVGPYSDLLAQITGRAGEGRQATAAVGQTLHQIADTYAREDATHAHALRNLY